MKKFAFLMILFLFPISVCASSVDYEIDAFHIEATINENGSVDVCEYIKQTGTFNGYIRDIKYDSDYGYGASGISNIEVYDLNVSNLTKGDKFTLVNNASNGDRGVYEQDSLYNGVSLTMYNSTNDSSSGYVVCYTLDDVVISHNDVAEFYWNFIGNEFDDVLNDVDIKVYLKQRDDSLRVWAHGPLYGEIYPYHDNVSYAHAKIDFVNPNTAIDVRMTFSLDNVLYDEHKSNEDALQNILDEEEERADIANKERKKAQAVLISKIVLGVGYFVTVISLVVYSYKKYDKEKHINFNHQYFRDFPNTYGPEVLQYLNEKNVDTKGYSASILEIIRKKALRCESINGSNKDYKLIINTPVEELTSNEKMIYDFIINEIGNGKEVELDDIKSYGKKQSTAKKFLDSYNDWVATVKFDCEKYNFFEKIKNGKIIFVILILTIIVGIIEYSDFPIFALIIAIVGFISIVYEICIKRRTEFGALEYEKWQAFKRFLEDFGRFSEKELPEIALWEKYLVYATVLGVADKLQKTMQIKIKEFGDVNGPDFVDMYMMHYIMVGSINRTITNTVSNAVSVSRSTIASSSSSSGSGFGGGFSGGGGGFGGGGGGGRGF